MNPYRGISGARFKEIDSTLHRIARTLTDPAADVRAWSSFRLAPGRQHWLLNGEQWIDYEIDRPARTVTLLAFGTFPAQRPVGLPDRATRREEDAWDSEGGANHR
jgi:hypothetical protein